MILIDMRTRSWAARAVVRGALIASVTSSFGAALASPAPRALVWVGSGVSQRYEQGRWVRTPQQDYTFMVYQRRFERRWESQKIQNRASAGYAGEAGPADQQHMVVLDYEAPDARGQQRFTLRSTYGDGAGQADEGYRRATLELKARGLSRWAPYSHIRITQAYDYEGGTLDEVVELFKRGEDGQETPFVRVTERARLYRAQPEASSP